MKKQRFLFTLLMAIVMMAFSPTIAWAQEDGGDPDSGYEEPTECTHSDQYYSYAGDRTHELKCSSCGDVVHSEGCDYGNDYKCRNCGEECEHSYNDDGKCEYCGKKCTHTWDSGNGYCSVCHIECPHDWSAKNGICKNCGYHCDSHDWNDSRCTVCGLVCNNHTYNTDGNCNTCGITTDIVSVTIGGKATNYSSLSDALTAACAGDPATITLLQDFTFTQDSPISISQGNVTLDLNGHKISAIEVDGLKLSGGSLTIMDSGNTGEINTTVGSAVYATGGTITIHGGTFKTNSGPALQVAGPSANVSIDGGRFIGNMAIILGGKSALAPGYSYYITDTDTELADVTSGPVWTPESYFATDITVKPGIVKATLTIGGETTNYYDFKKAFDDALEVSSATITMLGDVSLSSSLTVNKGNVTLDLNGHTISTSGPNTLNLSGGSLTIKDSSVGKTGTMKTSGSYALDVAGGSITIQGGTFSASGNALNITSSNVTASLECGIFKANTCGIYNQSGKSILADGYAFYNSNDEELPERTNGYIWEGNYPAKDITVKPATVKGTLTIGGETTNYYHFNTAFSQALDAASATIKMLKDVDLLNGQAPYSLDMDRGNLTLDLNGHTISSSGPNTLNLSGGSLTIKDSSVGKTGTMKTSGSYALNVTGGSITIQGGTFSASSYALNITSSNVTASLEGGVFKASSGGGINNESGKSILADGYAFYNSNDEELPERTTGYILEGNYPARDITVKPGIVKATLTIGGETTDYCNFNSAFSKALDAGSAVTMTILKDVDLVIGASTYSLNMDRGNLTLDLNGHTINQPIGGTVLNISGGEFIIVDTSNGKTGTIKTDGGSALRVTGGSITIHDGTFSGASGPALYISQDATAFIDRGIFISSKGSAPAIENHSGRSILANGYALYNADDVELQETVNGSIWDGNSTAKYIIVKAIPVASVTTSSDAVEYYDFKEAMDAACNAGEAATVTLLHDVANISTYTLERGIVTLDLNSHSLGFNFYNGYDGFIIKGGNLTITDNSDDKLGQITDVFDYTFHYFNGSLTIHAGTFYATYKTLNVGEGEVTIDGGRFVSKENCSTIMVRDLSVLAPGYGFFNTATGARLTNIIYHELMDENGNPAKDVTVKPLVIDALDLADATPYDGKNAGCTVTDFTYTRNFGGTNWTTWYAPFDLELTDEICQKLAFSRINNVHQYDDDDNGVPDRTVIESFRQKAGVTLRANYPYLVKALNDADRNIVLHLSNVTLAPAAENSIDCNSVDYIYTFTGTYTGKSNNSDAFGAPYSLFDDVADNNWYHFHNLEPQRHYMVIEPTNGGQTPRNIKVNLKVAGEEDATGIVTLYSDKDRMQDEVEVYDLMGRKLNSNSPQRGLRIQNGKVIFNK